MTQSLPTYQHEIKPLTAGQLSQLFANLNPDRISQRSQGGAKLSYLEAWDVRTALIRTFGFGGWSADVIDSSIVKVEHDIRAIAYNKNKDAPKVQKVDDFGDPVFNFRVTAKVTMRLYIHQLGATYSEVAIASQVGPDVGEVADFAIKTAESDALKRCAINLGTTFGLSLYNSGSTGDVVVRSVAPGQTPRDRARLQEERLREERAADKAVRETGADPANGVVPDEEPQYPVTQVAPAEVVPDGDYPGTDEAGPGLDAIAGQSAPREVPIPEGASPEALAAAQDQIAAGFGKGKR